MHYPLGVWFAGIWVRPKLPRLLDSIVGTETGE